MNFNRAIILLLGLLREASSCLLSPMLPIIAYSFAATAGMSQLVVLFNMMGFTIATLVYGPLSDNWGRKKTLLIGLSIFTVSSALCFFAQDLKWLIFFRFLQGVGEGATVVISYSTINDMYDEIKSAKVMSQINFVTDVSSGMAPMAGAFIASYYGWQGIFIFLTAVGVAFLVSVSLYFKETLNFRKVRKGIKSNSVFSGYRFVLSHPNFIIYAIIESMPFIGFWGIVTSFPFILSNLGVKPNHYGFYVLILASIYLVGIILNQFLVEKVKINKLIMTGALLGTFDVLPLIWNYISPLTPVLIISLWAPNALGLAFIIGNSATKALEAAGDYAGAGSSVIVILYALMGVFGIFFIGKFCHGEIILLFWVSCLSSILTIILLTIANKRKGLENK